MYELMTAAESFSDEERYTILNDCNQYFYDKKEAGLTEAEIIEGLPAPKTIAAAYKAGEPMGFRDEAAESEGASPLGVLFFTLLIPVCGVYAILTFGRGAVAAVVLLALCIAAAFMSVACFGISSLSHGFILIGVGGLFATVALVVFSAAVFKATAAAFKWFPSFMGRTLRRRSGGQK